MQLFIKGLVIVDGGPLFYIHLASVPMRILFMRLMKVIASDAFLNCDKRCR